MSRQRLRRASPSRPRPTALPSFQLVGLIAQVSFGIQIVLGFVGFVPLVPLVALIAVESTASVVQIALVAGQILFVLGALGRGGGLGERPAILLYVLLVAVDGVLVVADVAAILVEPAPGLDSGRDDPG